MKKLLSALLILAMFASLTACGENAPEDDGKIDVYVLVEAELNHGCCSLTYDTEGKLTATKGGHDEEYTYDQNGNIVSRTASMDGEVYFKEEFSHIGTSVTHTNTLRDGSTQYLYDVDGRIMYVYGNGACAVNYLYDEAGRLIKVDFIDSADTIFEYDENGRLTRKIRVQPEGDQNEYRYEYDEKGRRLAQYYISSDGTERIEYQWTYDENGATVQCDFAALKYKKIRMDPALVPMYYDYVVGPQNLRIPIYVCNEFVDHNWL